MNIDLIIEALETALEMEFLCEYCGHGCISAGKKCKVDQKIKAALAEARKMKEPCEMIELLSEYAHDAWAGWMRYLFSKSTINADGTVTIPKWAVERWRRQIGTKYSDLSDSEKMSDRKEAETILSIVQKLKEPCVFTRIDGWATFNTGCGVYSNLSATDYCPGCGRKVKYED